MRRGAALLGLVVCASTALPACVTSAIGSSFQDSRRFSFRPEQHSTTEPDAKVNELLYGLYLLGFSATAIEAEGLRYEYLEDPNAYITNWQIVTGTGMLLPQLFTTPYGGVVFDVLDVEPGAGERP